MVNDSDFGPVEAEKPDGAPASYTPGPWGWENFDVECGHYCTPEGCGGHNSHVPEYLYPVGLTLADWPNDVEQWRRDAKVIAAAPTALERGDELAEALKSLLVSKGAVKLSHETLCARRALRKWKKLREEIAKPYYEGKNASKKP